MRKPPERSRRLINISQEKKKTRTKNSLIGFSKLRPTLSYTPSLPRISASPLLTLQCARNIHLLEHFSERFPKRGARPLFAPRYVCTAPGTNYKVNVLFARSLTRKNYPPPPGVEFSGKLPPFGRPESPTLWIFLVFPG